MSELVDLCLLTASTEEVWIEIAQVFPYLFWVVSVGIYRNKEYLGQWGVGVFQLLVGLI